MQSVTQYVNLNVGLLVNTEKISTSVHDGAKPKEKKVKCSADMTPVGVSKT